MKPNDLFVRLYGEKRGGQWSLICLEFNLAVQDESLEVARQKLHAMIVSYVRDASVGPDADQKEYFLRRRAPWTFFVKFYLVRVARKIAGLCRRDRMIGTDALPMAPVGA